MQDTDLFTKHPPDNEQRPDQHGHIGEVLDELLDARLKLNRPHHAHFKAEVAQGGTQVVLDGNGLRLKRLAMGQQHSKLLATQRLDVHRTIEPHPHHLCYTARIVAVRLVDLCLQHRSHVPRLNADRRQACYSEDAVKPLRQRPGFQSNSLEAIDAVRQNLQESFRLTCHSCFPHDLARIIHNTDARFLDRHVESSKIVHAALLLLMLEAASADLVSPSA